MSEENSVNVQKLGVGETNIYKEIAKTVKNVDLQSDLFATIVFPNLPYNFKMLMSNIDFPDKSKKNPNGSLFMKPMDIDDNSADDIAMQCFNSDKFKDDMKSGLKMTFNPTAYESIDFSYIKEYEKMLYEDTTNGHGADIKVRDIKSINDRMATQNANIVQAITTYVVRSISAINPLLQMVSSGNSVGDVKQAIQTANRVAYNNVVSWLKAKDSVERDKDKDDEKSEMKNLESENTIARISSDFYGCFCATATLPNSGIPADKLNDYIIKCASTLQNIRSSSKLDRCIRALSTFDGIAGFKKWFRKDIDNQGKYDNEIRNFGTRFKIRYVKINNESFVNDKRNKLFEDTDDSDDTFENTKDENQDIHNINYDKVQRDLFSTLSEAIDKSIGQRDEWKVMKDIANQMKFLKDNVDETIKERIKIVCKTSGEKSVFHYPKVANGLQNMWSRYSAELQTRIDNRIAQLTGVNGSRESGSASLVEDFLRTTYPQIISVLLTYRCIFAQISESYKRGYVPDYSLDDIQELIDSKSSTYEQYLSMVFSAADKIDELNKNN